MTDYDNTNSGALFNAANQKLVRAGDVDVNGTSERLAIVLTETKNGKTIFEVYQKVGAIFTNDDKKTDKHPDVGGKIEVGGQEYYMSGWKKLSKNDVNYTSVSLTPKEADGYSGPENPTEEAGNDLDDEIPF